MHRLSADSGRRRELYGCLTEAGAGAEPYTGEYEMIPLDVPEVPLPPGVTRETAKAVGHEGVEFFSWLDLLSSIEDDHMSQINVYEAARTCAGAIAVRTSKEEHRPVAIPHIIDRHEELKPLYPLPYAEASSDEL